jgi:mannose-6-phosphate isomerase-like protein (cupin superfamily)
MKKLVGIVGGLLFVALFAGLLSWSWPGASPQEKDQSKYGKYIVDKPKAVSGAPKLSPEQAKRQAESVVFPIYVDDEVVPGSYYFMAAWWKKITGKGSPAEEHTYTFDEYLIFLGTNPASPHDLGGEVELWIGGEKHMITKSCAIFIPAGVKHAPIYFRKITTPIWYLATGPTEQYKKAIAERAQ